MRNRVLILIIFILGCFLGGGLSYYLFYPKYKSDLDKSIGFSFYEMAHDFIISDDTDNRADGYFHMYHAAHELKNPYAQGTVIASSLSGYYMPIKGKDVTQENRQTKYTHIKFPFNCKMVNDISNDFPFEKHPKLGQCMIDERCNGNKLVGEKLSNFCEKKLRLNEK